MSGRVGVAGPPASATAAASVVERVVALANRDPRRALRLAERALSSIRRLDPADRARLLRGRAHALRAVGEYAAARRGYRASRRVFSRLGMASEWALGAIGLVDACMYLGLGREAVEVANGARPVFQRSGDSRRMAMLEGNLGNLCHREDRLEESLGHYDRAARLLAGSGSPIERAMVEHNRANVLILLGRREEAEAALEDAGATFTREGAPVLAAQTRYGIACLRFLSGEYAAAITELEAVRPELQRAGARPLLALADLDLAEVLLAIRLLPEAVALAGSATRWFTRHGVPADRARCLLIRGTALAWSSRPAEAIPPLDAAARLFRSQHSPTGLAAVAMARGRLALRQGRPAVAARHGREAHRVFARAGLVLRALAAGAMTAEALLEAGQDEAARNLARLLRRAEPRAGDAYSRARLARVEGAAAARAGDTRAALAHYREALEHAARSQSSLFVDEWRIGFLEGEPALRDEALGVLMRRRPAPRAAEVRRWLDGAAWDPRSHARLSAPSLGPDLRHRTAALRQELEACYARLWGRQAGGSRRMQRGATRALEQRALALESRLRRLAVGVPLPPAAVAPARAPRSAAGCVQLRYFSAAGRLGAIRVDARGASLVNDLAALEDVARDVRLFHYQMEVLASPEPALREHRALALERARQHLAAISERVLVPVLARGPAPDALRVEPHDALFRVPWHALPWQGRPLAQRCAVTLELAGGTTPAPVAHPRSGALVIGFGDELTAGIEAEARDVSDILSASGVPVRVHLGAEATRQAACGSVAGVALVHLAGHAFYRAEHPEFSALRLHDGWLHARDLAEMPFDGACVVLSACETGPRASVAGEQMLGLVRGILRAGARTMVSSLWRVDDQQTRAFMRKLYRAWAETNRLGAALQRVQRDSAAAGAELYLWAPFCLIGDPDAAWPAPAGISKALFSAERGTYA